MEDMFKILFFKKICKPITNVNIVTMQVNVYNFHVKYNHYW